MLARVVLLLQEAEHHFAGPRELTEEWLAERIQAIIHKEQAAPTFFWTFLVKEQIVSPPDEHASIEKLRAQIARFPSGYQRVVEVYLNERLAARDRQITLKAKNPLAL